MELAFTSIKSLKEKLSKKEISVSELLDYFIKRFEKYDSKIGSALEIFGKESILSSSSDSKNGFLSGIPGILKDNICQKNRIASCGSKILQNYRATYDSTAASRLKNDGALIIGRANMDEFAMGSSTETSAFKKTVNPWDPTCVPGGSSGGSIAAVAAGLVPWALGSETGGSVRQPASFCSVVGLKPTYGHISRYGLIAYASSLDQIGIATKTVYDNALVFSVLAGKDEHDSSSKQVSAQDFTVNLTGKLKDNFTLGIIENALFAEGIDPEIQQLLQNAIKEFEKLGAKIKYIKLPTMDYGAAVYFMVSRAEAASNLARFDGVKYGFRSENSNTLTELYNNTRSEGFGYEVKRRILIGNYVLSAGHASQFYESAKTVQNMMRQEFISSFKEVDLLFSPVTPTTAFKFGAFDDNKLAMDLQDYFTAAANLVGIPALAVPCGFTKNNMPIGFQLFGPNFSEGDLYQAAYAYENQTDFHIKYPQNFL